MRIRENDRIIRRLARAGIIVGLALAGSLFSVGYALADSWQHNLWLRPYFGPVLSNASQGTGFVDAIQRAPIINDGRVTGRPTDVVVDFRVPLDPNFPGFSLAEGESIVVELPSVFAFDDDEGRFPVCSFTSPDCPNACTPNVLECTTAVFLRGWAQSPIAPLVSLESGNRLVLSAASDITEAIKQAHLILKGFINPRPGRYTIDFLREDVDGKVLSRGSASLRILPRIRPSINIFSVPADGDSAPPHANTIYQEAPPGMSPPLDWWFLICDVQGEPMGGLVLQPVSRNRYRLKQGSRTVGHVSIDAPSGAQGQSLSLEDRGTIVAPLIGTGSGGSPAPDVRLYRARFTAGDQSGGYATTLELNRGGNNVKMFVAVD